MQNPLQSWINEDNNLNKLVEDAIQNQNIQQAFRNYYKESWKKKLAQIQRHTQLYVKKLLLQKQFIDEEIVVLLIHNCKIIDGKAITNKQYNAQKVAIQKNLRQKGYLISHSQIKPKTLIFHDNVYFSKAPYIIKFVLETNKHLQIIEITSKLIKQIKQRFHANIVSKRAFLAALERQTYLSKIDTNKFALIRTNEQNIAKQINSVISQISFNFLTKDLMKHKLTKVINEHKLMFDEFYYIFKKYYASNYFFSLGNSMFICRNTSYGKLSGSQRLEYFNGHNPNIYTREELALKFGIGQFGLINFKHLYKVSDNLILYLNTSNNHIAYMQKILNPFFTTKVNVTIHTKEIKNYMHRSSSIFLNKLYHMYSFKHILKLVYGKDIFYHPLKKIFIYKKQVH